MELYTIKPLEWEHRPLTGNLERWLSHTMFLYEVWENYDTGFRWGYSFSGEEDEEYFDCDSIADGKAKAEAHWRDRIAACLVPVKG